jgi:hypothetical protein
LAPLSSAWRRWRRLAHRAAEVQSHVLLFVLYILVVIPVGGLTRLIGTRHVAQGGGWTPLERAPEDLSAAHQQF